MKTNIQNKAVFSDLSEMVSECDKKSALNAMKMEIFYSPLLELTKFIFLLLSDVAVEYKNTCDIERREGLKFINDYLEKTLTSITPILKNYISHGHPFGDKEVNNFKKMLMNIVNKYLI